METVEFAPSLTGYVCGPKDAPGLVVVQEWWGVNQTIKDLVEEISSWGPYRCLIPDLYKGKIGVTAEEAGHLMNGLDFKAAAEELKLAANYLRTENGGNKKVGCTGFCMGGALSFAAAAEGANVECIAPFYGIPPAAYFAIENIKVPILAQFGALDTHVGFSDPDSALEVEKKLKAAGADVEVVIHPKCDHAYMNMFAKDKAHVEAVFKSINLTMPDQGDLDKSKELLVAFLNKHLN